MFVGGTKDAQDFDWIELGARIRQWRLARGMTQQQLAEAAGLTQSGLMRVESGQTNPQLASLQGIASALHCSVRELFCGKSESDPQLASTVQRVKSVVESGDAAAIRTLENGLTTAELLLQRSRQSLPSQVNKGDGRGRPANDYLTMNGLVGNATRQAAHKVGRNRRNDHKGRKDLQ
jgi:transcriptional regulator with XRE-family HTH domain